MACKECKRRKLEQSLKEPFCIWFPKDAEKARKELEYMDVENRGKP